MRRRKGQPSADIASRKTSKNRELSGEFLEGTESSVTEIEPTETAGFRDAWDEADRIGDAQSLDSAIDVGQDDQRVRDLDRSRTRSIVAVLVVLASVGAIAYFATQAVTEPGGDLGARASDDVDRNVISSPLAAREYSALVSPIALDSVAALEDQFIDLSGDGELVPLTDTAEGEGGIEGEFRFGAVFWADRLHIAVVSNQPLLASDTDCVITSLVTSELRAIDVAGAGSCDEALAATGDRMACVGDQIVLLEVWPFNPDSVAEPAVATAVRARIERRSTEGVSSLRGVLDVSELRSATPVVAASTTINGEPGDTISIVVDDLGGECELLDRGAVDVRLLPG